MQEWHTLGATVACFWDRANPNVDINFCVVYLQFTYDVCSLRKSLSLVVFEPFVPVIQYTGTSEYFN